MLTFTQESKLEEVSLVPMVPKDRKVRRQIYDSIYSHGCQNKIYACKMRLTTANFELCLHSQILDGLFLSFEAMKNMFVLIFSFEKFVTRALSAVN